MERIIPISIKNILVAVDGSNHAKKAAELGIDLAKLWKAKTYLLHVWQTPSIPKEFKLHAKEERISESLYFDFVDNQLFNPIETRLKEAGLAVDTNTLIGDPAEAILNMAEKYSVDLIILGSRGLGGFTRTIMGSVSTKVLNHADCTCIAVK